jgi:predicted aspartyl protease
MLQYAVLALLAFVVAAAAEPLGAAEARPPEMPYRRGEGDAVIVPVTLNGRGPFDFVLDTGTLLTRVDEALARDLGIRALGEESIVTITGARRAVRSEVERLGFGPHVLDSVAVVCGEFAARMGFDRRVRGLLGQSALSLLSYGIDYKRRRVVFAEPAGGRPARVRLEWREGRPAAVVRAGDDSSLALVLDSGLDHPVLFERADRPLPFALLPLGFRARTYAGASDLRAVEMPWLDLGGVKLRGLTAAVVPDGSAGGRREDGLLPTRLFASVFFHRKAGQIVLEPR